MMIRTLSVRVFTQSVVGRERRERVSQLAWRGGGCFDSRRRVNSDVRRLLMIPTRSQVGLVVIIGSALLLTSCPRALAIWLVPGSTATHLVLVISTSHDG